MVGDPIAVVVGDVGVVLGSARGGCREERRGWKDGLVGGFEKKGEMRGESGCVADYSVWRVVCKEVAG